MAIALQFTFQNLCDASTTIILKEIEVLIEDKWERAERRSLPPNASVAGLDLARGNINIYDKWLQANERIFLKAAEPRMEHLAFQTQVMVNPLGPDGSRIDHFEIKGMACDINGRTCTFKATVPVYLQ